MVDQHNPMQDAGVTRAPTPQEFLDQLQSDFVSQANAKEAEARELEDRMLFLRAEAVGLRTAAGGLEAVVERYHLELARVKEFADQRDGRDITNKEPVANYGGFPERKIALSKYDEPTRYNHG